MSLYQELIDLLGREYAGPLTIHIDPTGDVLGLHYAEKGNNPRGAWQAVSLTEAEAFIGGPNLFLGEAVAKLREEVERTETAGGAPDVKRGHLEVME